MYNIHVILIFVLVFASDGAKWYPATVSQEEKLGNVKAKDGGIDHQYVPLPPTNKTEETEKYRWHFKNKSAPANIIVEHTNTKAPVDSAKIFRFNNTINVINVTKRIRPRKKVVRRCPSVNRRGDKKLFSGQNARTRFLEVFEVVEFDHEVCTSSSGLEGTCLPEYECQNTDGSTMGTCADGYGTCCVSKFKTN